MHAKSKLAARAAAARGCRIAWSVPRGSLAHGRTCAEGMEIGSGASRVTGEQQEASCTEDCPIRLSPCDAFHLHRNTRRPDHNVFLIPLILSCCILEINWSAHRMTGSLSALPVCLPIAIFSNVTAAAAAPATGGSSKQARLVFLRQPILAQISSRLHRNQLQCRMLAVNLSRHQVGCHSVCCCCCCSHSSCTVTIAGVSEVQAGEEKGAQGPRDGGEDKQGAAAAGGGEKVLRHGELSHKGKQADCRYTGFAPASGAPLSLPDAAGCNLVPGLLQPALPQCSLACPARSPWLGSPRDQAQPPLHP